MTNGPCPYCGHAPIITEEGQLGLNCPSCANRIIVRNDNLYTIDAAKRQSETNTEFDEALPELEKPLSTPLKSKVLKILPWFLGALLIVGCALFLPKQFEASTPESDGSSASYRIGDFFMVGNVRYRVNKTEWKSHVGDEYFGSDASNRYLLVYMQARNEDEKIKMLPSMKLLDENGAVYEESPDEQYLDEKSLLAKDLSPKIEDKGIKLFDVPVEHQYELEVSGGYSSQERAYVQLQPRKKNRLFKPVEKDSKNATSDKSSMEKQVDKKDNSEKSENKSRAKSKKTAVDSALDISEPYPSSAPTLPALPQQVYRQPDWRGYMQAVNARLVPMWNPPSDVQASTYVVVTITLGRDGRVISTSVKTSSGNEQIDQSALQAVRSASPFPPLPVEFQGDSQTIDYRFDYLGANRVQSKKKKR